MPSGGPLSMWTIFRNPIDAPGRFVARRFEVTPNTTKPQEGVVTDTLEAARRAVSPGLVRVPRDPMDHPTVVETWV